jgi:hypothetical protein
MTPEPSNLNIAIEYYFLECYAFIDLPFHAHRVLGPDAADRLDGLTRPFYSSPESSLLFQQPSSPPSCIADEYYWRFISTLAD